MDKNELQALFAHALLVGFAQNGHLLTANADKKDVGRMIAENTESLVTGYLEGTGEQDGSDS